MKRTTKLAVVGLTAYVKPDVCGPCGGACCKQMPGTAFPSDFGRTRAAVLAKVEERLRSGLWCIDWWEGAIERGAPAPGYFLRPSTVDEKTRGLVMNGSWGGTCSNLGPEGCQIFDERPAGCRGLEPHVTKKGPACRVKYGDKKSAVMAWLPFHAELKRIGVKVQDEVGRKRAFVGEDGVSVSFRLLLDALGL